ncbi:hypothetical protein [Salinibacterium sp. SWN1162]|nr:hypothetical protein [Salinibacterium sp. SWN1162]MBH0008881.1 hypothetical protein [Salinibacterium sp. SWN1162]
MGFYQIQAGLALVPGLTTAFAVMRLGLENEVEDWGLWILPIVVAVVFGALFLILHYVASLEPAGPAELEDNEAEQNAVERKDRVLLARRRKRVARLSEAQRSQIRRDLADSFADLADRGLITADESRLAGEVELGGLAILGPRIAKTE